MEVGVWVVMGAGVSEPVEEEEGVCSWEAGEGVRVVLPTAAVGVCSTGVEVENCAALL